MSEENGKVCCNCRHNIRHWDKEQCTCRCDLDNHYIGYVECMTGWCRRWAKDKNFSDINVGNIKESEVENEWMQENEWDENANRKEIE